MLFNSISFVCFFVIVLGVYSIIESWERRKWLLLIASYVFYAAWNPPFVVLLWLSTVVDWWAARWIARATDPRWRRLLITISLIVNLGLLGFFKYGNFLLENFTALMHAMGFAYAPPTSNLVLPIGISFYTFVTLSYTLDIYRRKIEPEPSFLNFALYVTFFPHLVAGPIIRADYFFPQLHVPRRATREQLGWGLFLMSLGLFEKIVLADGLVASAANQVFSYQGAVGSADAWLGVLAFSSQIFCDFAGYSTCAVGTALCFGFALPDNFRCPYAAIGFSDFWRRWHISLSTWMRDYLYISFGGNRRGRARTAVNLMLTMLLGGLWHGAAWTFVAWGGLHGAYLIVEQGLRSRFGDAEWVRHAAVQLGLGVLTFLAVSVAWVFFRSQTFPEAWQLLGSLFGAHSGARVLESRAVASVLAVTGGLLVAHWWCRNIQVETVVQRMPWWAVTAAWAGMLITILRMPDAGGSFLYFQF